MPDPNTTMTRQIYVVSYGEDERAFADREDAEAYVQAAPEGRYVIEELPYHPSAWIDEAARELEADQVLWQQLLERLPEDNPMHALLALRLASIKGTLSRKPE